MDNELFSRIKDREDMKWEEDFLVQTLGIFIEEPMDKEKTPKVKFRFNAEGALEVLPNGNYIIDDINAHLSQREVKREEVRKAFSDVGNSMYGTKLVHESNFFKRTFSIPSTRKLFAIIRLDEITERIHNSKEYGHFDKDYITDITDAAVHPKAVLQDTINGIGIILSIGKYDKAEKIVIDRFKAEKVGDLNFRNEIERILRENKFDLRLDEASPKAIYKMVNTLVSNIKKNNEFVYRIKNGDFECLANNQLEGTKSVVSLIEKEYELYKIHVANCIKKMIREYKPYIEKESKKCR